MNSLPYHPQAAPAEATTPMVEGQPTLIGPTLQWTMGKWRTMVIPEKLNGAMSAITGGYGCAVDLLLEGTHGTSQVVGSGCPELQTVVVCLKGDHQDMCMSQSIYVYPSWAHSGAT